MKQFYIIVVLALSSKVVFSQTYSNPTHVEQFEKTGVCLGCDLSGVHWLSTSKSGAINLANSNLIRSALDLSGKLNRQYSNFDNIMGLRFQMGYGDFSYSNFVNADLRSANLVYNNFTSCDFTGANMSGSNLSGANLYNAKITKQQLDSIENLCDAILPDGQEVGC